MGLIEMPNVKPIVLLARVVEKEKSYDWIAAVKFYEKALSQLLQQKDDLGAGEFAERIGCCFHRGAMQAESRSEFEKKMKLAIRAYHRAQGLYEKLPVQQK